MDSLARRQMLTYDSFDFRSQADFQDGKIKIFERLLSDRLNNGLRILDIGCGDAYYSSMFDASKHHYIGLDISKKQILIAKKKGVDARVCDIIEGLPFSDNSFDVVICSEFIEHVLDTQALLKDIYRVLKPRGVLILSTPNIANLRARFRVLFGRRPQDIECKHDLNSAGHIRAFDKHDLFSLLQEADFVNVELVGFDLSKRIGPLLNFLTKFKAFNSLAGCFILKAEKEAFL